MSEPNDQTAAAAATAPTTEPQATTPAEPISTPAQETAPVAADAKQDSTPISSGAGDKDANKKPTSLLDAVKSAVAKKADAASSTVGNNGASAKDTEADPKARLDDAAQDKPKSEAAEKLPFHNHPRWKEMISERDALKPKAEEFEKITKFMSTNGLSNAEVVEGFQIMALMKTNPVEAHKKISEYKAKLDALVGETLPPEISRKVEEGYVDAGTAKQLAALQAEKQLAEQRQQYAMQQQAEQARESIHSAVVGWEQQMKAKDPDWSAKQDLVTDQVRLMMQTEKPNTVEEALSLVERAHTTIKDRLSRFAPRRQPVSPVASSSSSVNATAQPKTLLEAVRLGAMASR